MKNTLLPIHPRTGLQAVGWRNARRGEDGDQPIWPIAGASEEESEDESDDDASKDAEDESAGESEGDGDDLKPDDETNTLEYWKKRSRQNERDARKAAKRVADLEADATSGAKKDGEVDAEQIRRDAETAATTKANARIVRSEIRAAAAGKLADPKDALTFLDLTQFEVDDNGEVDSDEVADAIETLIKEKPYLAAATAKRFQGTGDGGAARKAGNKPKQVTEAELKTMTPDQIVKAQNEGRLATLLGAG